MRKRLTASAVAAVASIALLGASGQAFAGSQADTKPAAPSKLTVAAYKAWLKKTPGAAATLKAFSRLPAAKQTAFVGYLQNPKVYKAFTVSHDGDIPKSGKKTVRYNKDVTFTSSTTSTARTVKKVTTVSLSTTATERVFDIPVTTVSTQLAYQTNRDVMTGKGTKVGHKGTNFNAAFAITPSASSAEPEANMLDGRTTWTATPKFKTVGTKPVKKLQVITGLGAHSWNAQLINIGG
ncbi:hypothetical protein SGFS_081150 [Streptomyces graminofaciens]|uniref:Uncharacterized protein n=1 Tax=Streptomyces graminofaciens TaxID=68212 RepID=A0ABN5VTM2_9ACTN|nr:hypothetical protein [Streptomyces graminofaciens]BBC36821.1 hypothetical protein SGFS_081150 [Streptomyces graminofaciens]